MSLKVARLAKRDDIQAMPAAVPIVVVIFISRLITLAAKLRGQGRQAAIHDRIPHSGAGQAFIVVALAVGASLFALRLQSFRAVLVSITGFLGNLPPMFSFYVSPSNAVVTRFTRRSQTIPAIAILVEFRERFGRQAFCARFGFCGVAVGHIPILTPRYGDVKR
jgi:hypothetical protein